MIKGFSWARVYYFSQLLVGLYTTSLVPMAWAEAPNIPRQVALSAGELNRSLSALSEQFNIAIISDAGIVEGLESPSIQGSMSLESALKTILTPHHLTAKSTHAGILIERSEPSAPPSNNTIPKQRQDTFDRLEVHGYSNALELSYSAKYASQELKEYMFADEIGKLPERSIAEVLNRMPGVTITREAGEGRQVSVRGLDSGFTRVQFNGMESLATGASIDSRGGVNNTRKFDLNLIPAELIRSVEVYKSSNASIDGGGISGTVNLKTPLPLELSDEQSSISIEQSYNDFSETWGHGVSALLSRMNDTHSFGVALSGAYVDRDTTEKGYSTIRWAQGDWGNLYQAGRTGQSVSSTDIDKLESGETYHSRYSRYDVYQRNIKRIAGLVSAQWRPNQSVQVAGNVIAGNMAVRMDEYHISSSGLAVNDLSGVIVNEVHFDGDDLVYADLDNVDLRTEYNRERHQTDYVQAQLWMDYEFNSKTQVTVSLGAQNAKFDSPIHDKVYLWSPQQSFRYDFSQHSRISVNDYGAGLHTKEDWSLYQTTRDIDLVENRFVQTKIDINHELSPWWELRAGIQYKTYQNENERVRFRDISMRNQNVAAITENSPVDYGKNMGVVGLPSTWIVAGHDAFSSLYDGDPTQNQSPDLSAKLREYLIAGYLQTVFDEPFDDIPLSGNLGFRWESIRQRSQGTIATPEEPEIFDSLQRHAQILPSMNLIWQFSEKIQARFAANRNWSKAEIRQLNPSHAINVGGQSLNRGNPELKPMVADSIDVGLDWFSRNQHFISVGVFYKDIDSLVHEESRMQPFSETGLSLDLISDRGQDGDTVYWVSEPTNGDSVELLGAELSTMFSLWHSTDGAPKLSFNYTFSDAQDSYSVGDQRVTSPLIGLSRHIGNATLFYDTAKFGFRVSGNYRSAYVQSVPSGNNNDEDGLNSAFYLDMSGYYQWAESIRFDLEISNLTDEVFDLYIDSSNRPYNYTQSGTEFKVQLNVQI
ncbi:TonB-dependent receptor [Echinimonas agarilytica]|uniref:TonB-dependent receptor n=1 Tax=Echinimonas agarilytica TaxID=1215918 RepID=A0AA41W8E8_9GAMM|nr:TonB-dependent receptor [Echinimonas agarilytica]MCM2680343.1 TonB-dependent receptor [Echinimonas agarilytica]